MGFFNIQPFGSENNEKYGNNKQNDFFKRKFFNTVSLSHHLGNFSFCIFLKYFFLLLQLMQSVFAYDAQQLSFKHSTHQT